MARWILMVLMALGVSGAVSANWWCGIWSVEGEALLLRPTVYRPYAAILSPVNNANSSAADETPLDGRWVGNTKPGYDWGYRVGVGYEQNCLDVRANWSSWIQTNNFSLVVGADERIWPLIHPETNTALISPGILDRSDQFKVQSIDGEIGRRTQGSCSCWSARIFGGIRYSRIRYNFASDASGTNQESLFALLVNKAGSDVQGIGPRIGFGAGLDICWGIRLLGNASASLLFGSMKGSYLDFATVFDSPPVRHFTSSRVDPTNIVIGNAEGYFGLGYGYSLGCCGELWVEAGYRVLYFTHGILRAQFLGTQREGLSAVTTQSFALDGFVFKLGVSY